MEMKFYLHTLNRVKSYWHNLYKEKQTYTKKPFGGECYDIGSLFCKSESHISSNGRSIKYSKFQFKSWKEFC